MVFYFNYEINKYVGLFPVVYSSPGINALPRKVIMRLVVAANPVVGDLELLTGLHVQASQLMRFPEMNVWS